MSAVNKGFCTSNEDNSDLKDNRTLYRGGAYSNGSYVTDSKEDNSDTSSIKCPNLIQIDNELYRFRDPVLDDKRLKTIDIGRFKAFCYIPSSLLIVYVHCM